MLYGPQKISAFFLLLIIWIDYLGVATSVTLFPLLFFNTKYSLMPHVSVAAQMPWLGLLLAAYPMGQFFGMAILGNLSDRHGRRQLLLISLFGTCLGFLCTAFAIMQKNYTLLLICRGMTGLFAGNVAIAQASLSDISGNNKIKSHYISLAQMAMGSAYVIGPICGAWLSNEKLSAALSPTIPFYVFTIILLVLWSVTHQFFNETLTTKIKNEPFSLRVCSHHIRAAFLEKSLRQDFFIWIGFISGWWLFESYLPSFLWQHFQYSTGEISLVLAGNGLLYTAIQYGIIQRFSMYCLQPSFIRIGILSAGIAVLCLPYLHTTLMLAVDMILFVLGMSLAIPGIIQQISHKVSANQQGNIMGILGSLQALSTVATMLIGGYLNALQPSLSIVIGGALLMICSVLWRTSCLSNTKILTVIS